MPDGDPKCPEVTCWAGRGEEVDYDLAGNTVYQCDTCQALFALDREGRATLIAR